MQQVSHWTSLLFWEHGLQILTLVVVQDDVMLPSNGFIYFKYKDTLLLNSYLSFYQAT